MSDDLNLRCEKCDRRTAHTKYQTPKGKVWVICTVCKTETRVK